MTQYSNYSGPASTRLRRIYLEQCELRLVLSSPVVIRYYEWIEPSQGNPYGTVPIDGGRRKLEWRQNGFGRITIKGIRLGGNWPTPADVIARIKADIQQKFRVVVDSSEHCSGQMLRESLLVVQQDILRLRPLRRQAEEKWNLETVFGPEWAPEVGVPDA